MRVVRALSLIALLGAALSCQADVPPGLPGNGGTGGLPGGPGSGGHKITVGDNFYSPKSMTVSVGDTVIWSWVGNQQHSVTFTQQNGPDSGIQPNGSSFTVLETQSGIYPYYCKVHGANIMSGTITVQ